MYFFWNHIKSLTLKINEVLELCFKRFVLCQFKKVRQTAFFKNTGSKTLIHYFYISKNFKISR